MVLDNNGDPMLTLTSFRSDWYKFITSMFVLWAALLLLSLFSLWSPIRFLLQDRRNQAHTPGKILLTSVLFINVFVCCARLAFFVDPRGWEDRYSDLTAEVLLQLPRCLQMSQWLLIILRWRDLGLFADAGGLSRMVNWTPRSWSRITFAVIGCLTLVVLIFVFLGMSGIARKEMNSGANYVLGIFTLVFVLAGFLLGCSTATKLIKRAWLQRSSSKHLRRNKASKTTTWPKWPFGKTTEATSSEPEKEMDLSAPVAAVKFSLPAAPARKSTRARMAEQIVVSLALSGPLCLVLIIISIWRGNSHLGDAEFFDTHNKHHLRLFSDSSRDRGGSVSPCFVRRIP
eukprot:c14093_g1_i1.p1 GENE.c14093_g1_i1~~c14093_g1_i1.p1  ORF type:complete len:353 (-),score=45.01 c14093_g1_i1:243-1271(-)